MKKVGLLIVSLCFSHLCLAQKLVLKGSDTLGAKLVPMWAEAYQRVNHSIKFEIAAEGSTTGIAAIMNKTADIGMSSRPVQSTEISEALTKNVNFESTTVAYDAIAVVVNEANPVSNLNQTEVESIFTGDVVDWGEVSDEDGVISVYTRNTASGTFQDWKKMAMHKRDYALSSQKMAGNEQIVAEVAKNKVGIGYVGLAYVDVLGVKILSIDGVLPNAESARARVYPYARPLFFYTDGKPKGEIKKFIDFVLSAEGQKIVNEVGFIPIQ
ncbi:MAG: phosphate ABC transporter substrate-binding protein [Verrucomicrobiia bacterium]